MDSARTVFAGRPRTVKTRSTLNAPMPVLISLVHNRGDFAARGWENKDLGSRIAALAAILDFDPRPLILRYPGRLRTLMSL